MTDENAKSDTHGSSEIILGFVKALAWPFIAIAVLVSFWSPLHEAARMIPGLLAESESIQVGSVSLQVRKRLVKETPDAVRAVLRRLDADDVRTILSVSTLHQGPQQGGTMVVGTENQRELERYRKFADLGLVTPTSAAKLEEDRDWANEKARGLGFRLTALWDQTADFLMKLIPELLRDTGPEGAFEPKHK